MTNIVQNMEFVEVEAPIAAGSSISEGSDIVDMQGFDGVLFVVPVTDSAQNGVATMQIQQNTANSTSGMASLAGAVATATSATNDDLNDKLLIVDVYNPKERYVRSLLTSSAANIAYGNTIAIKYKGKKLPVTQGATVLASAAVAGPEEA